MVKMVPKVRFTFMWLSFNMIKTKYYRFCFKPKKKPISQQKWASLLKFE